jgi:glycosyltransferase involved in cell wall biosynthesis
MTSPVSDLRAAWPVAFDVGPINAQPTGVSITVSELLRALDTLAPGRIERIGRSVGTDGPLRGLRYLAWLQTAADSEVRAVGAAVVHYTNGVAPLRSRQPFALSIVDLSLLRRPGDHPASRLALAPFLVSAARRARLIIVPSRATAHEVRRLLHVSAERVVVIPLASRTAVGAKFVNHSMTNEVIGRLGLDRGRFVLSLGTIEPRKNHARLLAAFERLARDDAGLRLVLTGRWGWRTTAFRRALAVSPVRDRVVVTGHVADDVVGALLRSCAVMVYPSLYEGFGLPVLEAMAAGSPVVTSAVSSLPEAAGGAAILVDPYDVASIAAGITEAIARRDELIAAGYARAAGRSWLDVGRETLDAYRCVEGDPSVLRAPLGPMPDLDLAAADDVEPAGSERDVDDRE